MLNTQEPRKGDVLTADFLAQMLRELIRLGKFAVGPGLEIAADGAGIRITLPSEDQFRWAKAAGTIGPADGDELGSGPAEFLYKDDDGVLQPTGEAFTAWTEIEGEIAEDNILKVGLVDGVWAVFTARCQEA